MDERLSQWTGGLFSNSSGCQKLRTALWPYWTLEPASKPIRWPSRMTSSPSFSCALASSMIGLMKRTKIYFDSPPQAR